MDNFSGISNKNDPLDLPPGFRFHPTDEELITDYLWNKVLDPGFCAVAIGEADFNKVEPWDLPWRAKMGEKEWYFFCTRDKKYPTGLRTNRATSAGYWKATGKDKEIFQGKSLVGMKKTLVFYKGRAPKGDKTNWVMHEYRLEGKFFPQNPSKTVKNDWVISRVFEKTTGGKKTHISELRRLRSMGSVLPPLTDSSAITTDSLYVSCFSNQMNNPLFGDSPNPPEISNSSPFVYGNSQFGNSVLFQEEAFMRSLFRNYGANVEQSVKTEDMGTSVSQETGFSNNEAEGASNSVGMIEIDYLLNC